MTKRATGASRLLSVVFRVAIVAAAPFGVSSLEPPRAQAEAEKVTICHIPPGNPDNRHEITVSVSAVPAHVENHGDTIGTCGGTT